MRVLKSVRFIGKWRVVYNGRDIVDNFDSPAAAMAAALQSVTSA